MMILAFFIVGCVVGVLIWYWSSHFMLNLQLEIYQNYAEINGKKFSQNTPLFIQNSVSQNLTNTAILGYGLGSGLVFAGISAICADSLFSLWLALLLATVFYISLLDWRYQLVSTNACLWLFFVGLFGAKWQISPLTLEHSLESAVFGMGVLCLVYYIAKAYYQQEALGRGDYWLMLGIGSFTPYQELPQFLLVASLLGIGYMLWRRSYRVQLPFAPFLCLASLLLWLWRAFGLQVS